jgi:hypothetical protein
MGGSQNTMQMMTNSGSGFVPTDPNAVAELAKALASGYEFAPPPYATAADGFALKVESLDNTLYNVTFTMNDIQLWKLLPKVAVYNTVHQHSEIHSYSQNPRGGWFAEGGAPAPDSATYIRRLDSVKYIGTQRGVTHQMSLTRTLTSDAVALETVAGTMDLLQKTELGLIYGNSDLSPLQWDGFVAQINKKSPASNIIDLRGAAMGEDDLINAATTVRGRPNFGMLTHIMCDVAVKGDIQRTFIPRERSDAFVRSADGIVSQAINGIDTPAGIVQLVANPFMADLGDMPTATVGAPLLAPAVPSVTTAPTTPTSANSKYYSADAGQYYVFVVACNSAGSAAPVQVGSGAITIGSGQALSFGVTPGSGNATEWFEVYRTPVNGLLGTQRCILQVPNVNPATGAAMTGENTVVEINSNIPGTGIAIGFQMNEQAVQMALLSPMLRIPLPIQGTTIPWIQVLYGVPILTAPGRIVLFKNIGRLPRQNVLQSAIVIPGN